MKAITANRLTDGRVVYFTARHDWSASPSEALRLSDVDAEHTLVIASRDALTIVGPYLIEVEDGPDALIPAGRKHVRETIRQSGPSAGSTRTLAEA